MLKNSVPSDPERDSSAAAALGMTGAERTLITDHQRGNEDLAKLFRWQLGNKQYKELENTWLELIESDLGLKDLLTLVELVVRWASSDIAAAMLSVLATSLEEKGRYQEENTVLRRLIQLTPGDEKLTESVSACLRKLYKDEPLLERLLQKAGLGYGVPLLEALKAFDQLIRLTPNRLIYDQERGPGRVKSLDLLFDRVTITFNFASSGAEMASSTSVGITGAEAASGELTVDIATANQRFSFPLKDGFFYLLNQERDSVLILCNQDAAGAIGLFLRDIGKPATPDEIQNVFESLLGKEDYLRFWEKAKKGLSRHPHIKIQTKPIRAYSWMEEPSEKPLSVTKTNEIKAEKFAPMWTPEELQKIDSTATVNKLKTLRSPTARKKFLEELIANRPTDWDSLCLQLFAAPLDSPSRKKIAQALQQKKPAVWSQLVETVFADYRSTPEAFLFLLEENYHIASRQTLSRLLDLVELDVPTPLRNQAKKLLVRDNYRLIRTSLKDMDETESTRFVSRFKRLRILEKFQEDEIIALISKKPGESDSSESVPLYDSERWIWSSAQGVEKARNELTRLLQEELPRLAEELSRARGYGDLSENYEYKAAKEKQARVMARINQLRRELALARVIQPEAIDTSTVNIGCRVKLTALPPQKAGSKTPEGVYEYSILGPWDSDPEEGIISFQSPLAQRLLGKRVGDVVDMGEKRFIITEITSAL